MTLTELELLLAHFQEEKEYIADGYYRIRKKDENHYELAFLMPDSCGTTSINPQITVKVEAGRVTPVSLTDFYSTPVRNLVYSEATAAELDVALVALVAKFKQAKKLS